MASNEKESNEILDSAAESSDKETFVESEVIENFGTAIVPLSGFILNRLCGRNNDYCCVKKRDLRQFVLHCDSIHSTFTV